MNLGLIRNLKIWQKILLFFQFMMLPALVIFFLLMISIDRINDYQKTILLDNVSGITAASNLKNTLLRMRELKAYYVHYGNLEWITDFNRNVESFNYWYEECYKTAQTEEERDILSTMSVDFTKYMNIHNKILNSVNSGNTLTAERLLLVDSHNVFEDIFTGCEKIVNQNKMLMAETEKKLQKYTAQSRKLAYATLTCFFLSGIALMIVLIRSIVEPIKEIEEASRNFSTGDSNFNETEMLKDRFTKMIESIKENQRKLVISEKRAAVGEIAAGISHELNNPVGIIYGFAEILVNKEKITESDREYIEDIFRESGRCKKLLKDLLDFVRTPEPCCIETDIADLIEETAGLILNQVKYKNVIIEINNTGTSVNAFIDPFQVKQVILNLLFNSCDAMNNEGRIIIRVENNEKFLTIAVKDHGQGIKPENLEKIFTPFSSTKSEGVGLGLAICRDIITKHNGTITAGGKFGEGAEFTICIPAVNHEDI